MHIEDAYESIKKNDLNSIEELFHLLVHWARKEEPPLETSSSEELMDLLARVTGALSEDTRFMSSDTCLAISRTAAKPVFTYAAGAQAVTDHREHWRSLFGAGNA